LFGTEVEDGRYTNLHPAFARLAEAVTEAAQWNEERMRAVGAELLWERERRALKSDNPYLLQLAAAFLKSHEAADVVDQLWGAPGTPERKRNEDRATDPRGECLR
jgi:hypothetical protein